MGSKESTRRKRRGDRRAETREREIECARGSWLGLPVNLETIKQKYTDRTIFQCGCYACASVHFNIFTNLVTEIEKLKAENKRVKESNAELRQLFKECL